MGPHVRVHEGAARVHDSARHLARAYRARVYGAVSHQAAHSAFERAQARATVRSCWTDRRVWLLPGREHGTQVRRPQSSF